MKSRYIAIVLSVILMMTGCGGAADGEAVIDTNDTARETAQSVEDTDEQHMTAEPEEAEKDSEMKKITEDTQPDTNEVMETGYMDISGEQLRALSKSSVEMFVRSTEGSGNKNVLISPTSLLMALAMTENGAGGETLSQMENAVNGGLTIDEMNPLMRSLRQTMNKAESVEWNNANSIWFKDDGELVLKDGFVSNADYYYGAELFMAPFDAKTVDDINGWVSDNTKERIPEIIDSIDPLSRAILINAISFDGEWDSVYEDRNVHEGEIFHGKGGDSKVTMLSSTEDSYFRFGNATGFSRPYKGYEYSFVGLLPDEEITLEDYLGWMEKNAEGFAEAVNDRTNADVYVTMPEFRNEYDIEMNNVLKAMGMTDAFNMNLANFDPMMASTTDKDYKIWIERVVHKTYIDVNRTGTSAAAATMVEMRAYATAIREKEIVYINLDRPFVYAIVDNDTGLPIFLGCINDL